MTTIKQHTKKGKAMKISLNKKRYTAQQVGEILLDVATHYNLTGFKLKINA